VVRSNKSKTTQLPESTPHRMSLETLRRADSVLWPALKPDWNLSKNFIKLNYHQIIFPPCQHNNM